MITFETLDENFTFLLVEVESQVKRTCKLLNAADPDLFDKIISQYDYVDNLNKTIENKCFAKINRSRSAEEIDYLRSVHVIGVNLERIAGCCVNIARQTEFLNDLDLLHKLNHADQFTAILDSLSKIQPVLDARQLTGAIKIGQAETELDRMYKNTFQWIMVRLRDGYRIEDLMTTLFIFQYIERIGDYLLNIGEALIFAILGERIKTEQFKSLQVLTNKSKQDNTPELFDYEGIWGSRSGCRIGRISTRETNGKPTLGIFKEGPRSKILKEKNNLDYWHKIIPDLAPGVINHQENSESAALLVEFLPGMALDEIILTADVDTIQNSVAALQKTITTVWLKTRQPDSIRTDYIDQIYARLDSVYRIHPGFQRPLTHIETLRVESSDALLRACAGIESATRAPFSTFIHGDFNVNNIIFNQKTRHINYIDLHRSKQADYVQDVSVFLISNFRIPIFEPQVRRRINWVIHHFYGYFADFAKSSQDTTFELRLALALARSFYTSTRFELNAGFARVMFKRAHYLLEKILSNQASPDRFRLPVDILYY